MKILNYSITTIAAICIHASAFASEYKFSGIEWLSTKERVKEVLTNKGYAFSEIDKDGDLIYSGDFMGQKSQILCIINPQSQIVKLVVRWQTPDSKCLDFYAKIKEMLTSKYGQPCHNFEIYKTPYYKGDGFEEQAIKMNKATISSYWTKSRDGSKMGISVSQSLCVDLQYESKYWDSEGNRRSAESAKDL